MSKKYKLKYKLSLSARAIYRQKTDIDLFSSELTAAEVIKFAEICHKDLYKVQREKASDDFLTVYFCRDVAFGDKVPINPKSLNHSVYTMPNVEKPETLEWMLTTILVPAVEKDILLSTEDSCFSTGINPIEIPNTLSVCVVPGGVKSLQDSDVKLLFNAGVVRENALILSADGLINLAAAIEESIAYLAKDFDWKAHTRKRAKARREAKAAADEARKQAALKAAKELARREAERKRKEKEEREARKEAARLELIRLKEQEAKRIKDAEDKARRVEQTRRLNMQTFIKKAIANNVLHSKKAAERIQEKIDKLHADAYVEQRKLANFTLQENKEEAVKGFMRDYDRIKSSSKVQNIEIKNQTLTIVTNPITALDRKKGRRHNLGRLQIKLNFGGELFIFARSLDYNTALPHTRPGSYGDTRTTNICAGNTTREFAGYLSNYEILAAFTLIIAFFEKGVDSDDNWGANVNNFPRI